jgi:carboxypeptidase Taq
MLHAESYEKLVSTLKEIGVLESIGHLLGWDEQAKLPPRGTEHRASMLSLVARMQHEQFTSPKVDDLLREVEGSDLAKDPESDPAANVRELRREYDRARKLPASLVEEMAETAVLSQHAWTEARAKSQFNIFEPWLGKTLNLKRREAECIGYGETGNPYDALLDHYEPRETSANIQKVFDSFRPQLVDLIGRIAASANQAPVEILERHFPATAQEKLAREAASALGFDFQAGRLDTSVHPFCSGIGPGDTRMTTRYNEGHFSDAFFGVLHETGHCLYEQGLPKAQNVGLPLGRAISLGIHESQSRMWENLVGRSRAFWKWYYPKTKAALPDALKDVSEEQFYFAVNDIRATLIRVEADEATYNLHIMLRFEIEQAMLRDEIKTRDIPAAWNERMKKYLGITPPDDKRGCLQDIHWSGGAIGYFATYSLGNLYAAQFFEKARADLGDLDAMFAKGEFAPLLDWLRKNIHRHGRRYTAAQLVKKVTGKELSPDALMRHLSKKAQELYGV